ncbi:Phenylacetic acid catabolic protein [Domibacillus epiphyticus]|uniref:Phenylacetic acid catabolism protein n=1 Tax=Domibacillus epiphyticus TaxID=1714355 RepID=A0A1V2A8N7_9BACI|nr:Phenylacetic acid catabolic protein [Domibacillus epiphyticus]OMP67290.1 phenylacetic acid catabolism protein [Domibacillus epiphyticus]
MAEQDKGLQALTSILETIADNKYLLGDRLVEVGISGPRLESTLSAVAMAQGELGHARLLYNWSLDLKGFKGSKPEIEKQTGKAFPFVERVNDWLSLIAALYAVNLSVDIVLRAILEADEKEVASRIHKLVREQKEHIVYTEGWVQQLLEDSAPIQEKFQGYLDSFILEAVSWLKSIEGKKELADGNYILPNAQLAEEFDRRVQKMAVPN